jgi:hypothetical protein
MPIGQFSQDGTYNKPPATTLEDLGKALGMIGEVKSLDPKTFSLTGKAKYGMQKVDVKAMITQEGNGSHISLTAFSDDIWGMAAKDICQRLLETLHKIDDPNYKPNKAGLGINKLILRIAIFLIVLFVILGGWMTGIIPPWVMNIIIAFGGVMLIYFIIARAVFKKKG